MPGSDFKSDGGRGDASPAGSIPVRFRLFFNARCAAAELVLAAIACAAEPARGDYVIAFALPW